MVKQEQRKSFDKPLEMIVNATPAIISSVIKTAVSEFKHEEELTYSTEVEPKSSTDNYRKVLVIALGIAGDCIAATDCIGIITLQYLASNRTLFRIPPRSNWYFSNAPKILRDLQMMGHVRTNEFNLYWDESYFTKVLERIVSEFYRLNFLDLKTLKEPLGFKPPTKEQNT
jgi:hypothetical protein